MSSLLDEAIVDAKALREAVLKNAEASLLEAYAPKIEETVARLLEQDPAAGLGVGPMDVGMPPADIGAPPGGLGVAPEPEDVETPATFTTGEEEKLDIGYGALSELDDDSKLSDNVDIEITRGELQAMLESITKDIETLEEDMEDDTITPKPMDEGEIEIDEDILEAFELDEEHCSNRDELDEKEFPDLTGDGKVTQADILKGRGVDLDEAEDAPGGPEKITLQPGDTLSSIADKYQVSVAYIVGYQLSQGNEISSNPDDVKAGQTIMMPGESLGPVEKYEQMGREHMEGSKKESLEITEDNIADIVESLVVDIMPVKSGWAGTPESVMQYNEKLAAAMAQSDKYKEEKEELLKVGQSLQESLEKHQTVNAKLKEVVDALKEKLDEVNLTNAKLLYTNRILRKSSLNERQKNKIVEALSNAGSVNEAKVLYETLQNAVGSSRKEGPQSLSEAVSRPSTMLPRRKVQDNESNSFTDRMKMLAGIKN